MGMTSICDIKTLENFRNYYKSVLPNVSFPTSKDEMWRYGDMSFLFDKNLNVVYNNSLISYYNSSDVLTIVIYNNWVLIEGYQDQNSVVATYVEGIKVFLQDCYFSQQYQVLQNYANVNKILYINILQNVKLKIKFHLTTNQNISIFLNVSDNVDFELIEEFFIPGGVTLNYVIQARFLCTSLIQHIRYNLGAGNIIYSLNTNLFGKSNYCRYAINSHSSYCREYLRVNLHSSTSAYLYGVTNGFCNQFYDNIIQINHLSSLTQSLQKYFQVLHRLSKSSLYCEVDVKNALFDIIAKQLTKNLLLHHTAKSFVIPKLKIKTKDISCSHGATISYIDDALVDFCNSRGISKDISIKLISSGFLQSNLSNLKINKQSMDIVMNHINQFS